MGGLRPTNNYKRYDVINHGHFNRSTTHADYNFFIERFGLINRSRQRRSLIMSCHNDHSNAEKVKKNELFTNKLASTQNKLNGICRIFPRKLFTSKKNIAYVNTKIALIKTCKAI